MKERHLLEGVHAETGVHSGGVGEEASDGSFKEETEGEHVVSHSLLEERVAASFANDQIGPLHNHDGNEEGRVAGVFQLFAGGVRLETRAMQTWSMIVVNDCSQ